MKAPSITWPADARILTDLLDAAPDGILVADRSGRIVYANTALEDIFGFAHGSSVGHVVEELLPNTRRSAHAAQREGRNHHHRSHAMGRGLDVVGCHRMGHELSLDITLGSFDSPDGPMTAAFVRDVSEERQRKADLERLSRALKLVHDCNETLVRATDEAALLDGICSHLVGCGGYRGVWVGLVDPEAAQDPEAGVLPAWPVTEPDSIPDPVRLAMQSRETAIVNIDFPEGGGAAVLVLPFSAGGTVCGSIVFQASDEPAFHAAERNVLQELADDLAYGIDTLRGRKEQHRQAEAIRRHEDYDNLTGLPRRHLLSTRIDLALAGPCAASSCVLSIGLDQFTRINEAYGHEAGDQVLAGIAERLQAGLRQDDVLARLAGDEFAILLGAADSDVEIAAVADRLRRALHRPLSCAGQEISVTATIGASVGPRDGSDAATLLARAETAMFDAKAAGRDSFGFYRPHSHSNARRRIQIEHQLRDAIGRSELELHYQPIVALDSGIIVSAEALLRWNHPDRGLVSPGEFIPLAEDTGQIVTIGRWVIEEACRKIAAWRASGRGDLTIAVNVSARQLADAALEATIEHALASCMLPAEALTIEVTESMLMRDFDTSLQVLNRLKERGIGVSIDDFGTGYSSLAYLKRLPVDWVKIDRSFVSDIVSSTNDAAIAAAVTSMSHAMNLGVVAEGVETEEQRLHLGALGCDRIQGYLFSRPIPAPQFFELFASGRRLEALGSKTQRSGRFPRVAAA